MPRLIIIIIYYYFIIFARKCPYIDPLKCTHDVLIINSVESDDVDLPETGYSLFVSPFKQQT